MSLSTAALASLLPLPVAIPLAAGALCPVAVKLWRRLPIVILIVSLAASGVLLLAMAPTVYGGHLLTEFMGHYGPVHGHVLGIAFAADPWGLSFALIASLIGPVIGTYSLSELSGLGERERAWFAALFLFLVAGLIGSALTADLINLFVWFEVAAIASYALTAFFLERPIALEASFKVLVLTNIASFGIFLGAALLYQSHGALDLGQLGEALHHHVGVADLVALALLTAGFLTKAGVIPMHGWLPDAHTAAPGSVSALFSGLMVNLGIVAVGRIVFEVFLPGLGHPILGLLMVLGLISAICGAAFALFQDELKRLLAYDTISQMGVLLVGLATGRPGGVTGTAYHLWNHALFKTLLFLCAGAIVHTSGVTKLSEMGSIARRSPWIAAAFCFGVVAISGLPPLNGYGGIGLIHDALREKGQWVPFAGMIVAQTVTIAALGRAAYLAFFQPRDRDYERDERLRPGMTVALSLLAAGCLGFGVLPGFLVPDVMAPAAGALLHPVLYRTGVLAGGGPLRSAMATFDYFSPIDLLTVLGTVLAAIPLGLFVVRSDGLAERARVVLARVQTGSVNDYASYLVLGVIAIGATLVL